MRTLRRSLLTAMILLGLAACGQKGPLYLPEGQPEPAVQVPEDEDEDAAAP